MNKKNREQFDDGKFYKGMSLTKEDHFYDVDFPEIKLEDYFYDEDLPLLPETKYVSPGLPQTLAGIHYYQYGDYEIEFERMTQDPNAVFFDCQKIKLGKEEFNDLKNRVMHFKSAAETVRQKLNEKLFFLTVLFLNPYQKYGYGHYLAAYESLPHKIKHPPKLDEIEFYEFKRKLLLMSKKQNTFLPIKSENKEIIKKLLLDLKHSSRIKTIYDI